MFQHTRNILYVDLGAGSRSISICKDHQVVHLRLAYFTTSMYVYHASKQNKTKQYQVTFCNLPQSPELPFTLQAEFMIPLYHL